MVNSICQVIVQCRRLDIQEGTNLPRNLEKQKRTIEVNRVQVLKPNIFEQKKIYQFLSQKDSMKGEDNIVLIKSAGKKVTQFAPLLFKHLREID